jgi:muramoyltetrapeptide carboxypeptidase
VSRAGSFAKPTALRPGDAVAVAAPAGPFDRPGFEAGLAVLAARYRVLLGEGIFARARYLAGDDGRRLDELAAALTDDGVRAVFAARGGYGAMRLLSRLAPKLAGLRPRPVVGFSDITALHAVLQAAGWVSIHGPVVTQLGGQPPEVAERLFRLLESPGEPAPSLSGVSLVGGVAEGPLVGGNLSLLTRLLGTPHLPPLDGAVLLLEDVGERPYRLDRMWTHLALAGVFDRVRGLALGEFTDCEEPGGDHGPAEVLAELAAETGLPCVGGLPIGHGPVNQPVPLGARVRLDAGAGRLEFLEPAVGP